MLIKRGFDLSLALLGMVLLLPLLLLISILVALDSRGGVFYSQYRIGYKCVAFKLIKFRTMYVNADKLGLLTIGNSDRRITQIGYWLRKYKLDELPQLINIILGDMSFVGPRPEVPKYVRLYSVDQLRILSIKPGLTGQDSINYFNESELLANAADPEKAYITEILPKKVQQNLAYIDHRSFWGDITIIYRTAMRVFRTR